MNEGAVMKSAGKKAEIQKQKAGQETIRLTDTHTHTWKRLVSCHWQEGEDTLSLYTVEQDTAAAHQDR